MKASNELTYILQILKGQSAGIVPLDEQRLLQLLNRHRLSGIFLQQISEKAISLSGNKLARLKNRVKKQGMQQLMQVQAMQEIKAKLNNAGIEAVFLKGPLLAHHLYKNIHLRHSVDIDLLVNPKNLKSAANIVNELGFVLEKPNDNWSPLRKKIYQLGIKDWLFLKPPLALEMHYRLFPNSAFRKNEQLQLQKEKTTIELHGLTYPFFSDEFLLVYLSAHGAVHQFFRLFWLWDIHIILTEKKPDTAKALHIARQFGAERHLLAAIKLSHTIFGTSLPVQLSPWLEKNHGLAKRLHKSFMPFIMEDENENFRKRFMRLWALMKLHPSPTYKWKTFWGAILRFALTA